MKYVERSVGRAHRRVVVFGFPVRSHAYTYCLYAALEDLGIEVREGVWAGRWLLANVKAGDLIHIHWPSFCYYDPHSRIRTVWGLIRFIAIMSLLRLRGARLVWTAHNLYPHDGGKSAWSHRVARRFLAAVTEAVLVHGPTAASIVEKELSVVKPKLRQVPIGHWIGHYTNTISRWEARERLGLSQDAFVFAFLGLCKPYKGLESLIEAFAKLDDDSSLLIAGQFQSAEYLAAVQERIKGSPGRSIAIYPRYIEDADIQIYANAADAFVLPYRDILTSGAAMLAMSFGRPVVAPNLGAMSDFVAEDCGVLYDPDTDDALTNAMKAVRKGRFDEAQIMRQVSRFTWVDAAKELRVIAQEWRSSSPGSFQS